MGENLTQVLGWPYGAPLDKPLAAPRRARGREWSNGGRVEFESRVMVMTKRWNPDEFVGGYGLSINKQHTFYIQAEHGWQASSASSAQSLAKRRWPYSPARRVSASPKRSRATP